MQRETGPSYRKMRWWWRVLLAILTGLVVNFGMWNLPDDFYFYLERTVGWTLMKLTPAHAGPTSHVYWLVRHMLVSLPAILSTAMVLVVLNRWYAFDGHTHCGRCGYILKGLVEPRCPECGNRI